MTEQERKWFETLSESRRQLKNALHNNNCDSIWDAITFPYSDQAHFVYELLQNADDSGATEVRFELYNDRLIFTHNGTRRFSISDPAPERERQDAENGVLGDVNSITAAGNSTKNNNSIGKFGIGFKSVFVYTTCPKIYDDNLRFSISDYVPGLSSHGIDRIKFSLDIFNLGFDTVNLVVNPFGAIGVLVDAFRQDFHGTIH